MINGVEEYCLFVCPKCNFQYTVPKACLCENISIHCTCGGYRTVILNPVKAIAIRMVKSVEDLFNGIQYRYPPCCVIRFALGTLLGSCNGAERGFTPGGYVPCGTVHKSKNCDKPIVIHYGSPWNFFIGLGIGLSPFGAFFLSTLICLVMPTVFVYAFCNFLLGSYFHLIGVIASACFIAFHAPLILGMIRAAGSGSPFIALYERCKNCLAAYFHEKAHAVYGIRNEAEATRFAIRMLEKRHWVRGWLSRAYWSRCSKCPLRRMVRSAYGY